MGEIIAPLELINIQAEALFLGDAQGRLRYIREPGYPKSELYPAPRFFMGRTRQGNIVRFRVDLPDQLVQTLEEICRDEPVASDFVQPPQQAAAIRAALSKSQTIAKEVRGPAYWIPDGLPLSENGVLITEANKELLETYFPWAVTSRASFRVGPLAATVVAGKAVAICHCARIMSAAAEAGVETAESYRGQGYAGAAVATWANAIRQQGLLPLYSTSWDNLSSQRVAHKLNMICYGDDWSIF